MASRRRERRKGSSQEPADGNGAGSVDDSEDVQFDFPVESDPTPPATTSFPSQNGESADGDGAGPDEVSERPPIDEDPRLIPNVTAGDPDRDASRARAIPRDPRSLRIDRERPKMPAGLRRLGRRSSGTIPPPPPPPTAFGNGSGGGSGKPRMKKLRFAFVLAGLTALAGVSTVFGMMMAVASDLPALEDFAQYRASKNTVVLDVTGERIGTLSSNENKILLESNQISPHIKNAVVAIEDRRFYEHRGVDFEGIGRALVQDILSLSAKQGASTITQQFVKQALEAQNERTVFQKLKEAALAYHLERRWTKDKILTEYLNTIYFGQGAYGIEAAARTYFGDQHPGCGTESDPCAAVLLPEEAALLAGMISSPAAYDPKVFPENALARRNQVLDNMLEEGYIDEQQHADSIRSALPPPDDIEPPSPDSESPYFTDWLRQQLVDRAATQGLAPGYVFFGGLTVHTTLDMDLQVAAEDAVCSYLCGLGPTASVVVIDNETGGVSAMVGGPDYDTAPFNLATQGHRQPGSSIKPFTLVTALEQGYSAYSPFYSEQKSFPVPNSPGERFIARNYGDSYLGPVDLETATINSDNSVYAELGLEVGTENIAETARQMGVETPLSTNPSMTLGGLEVGVTPLEWAYAYSTLANDGRRVTGSFSPDYEEREAGPVAFTAIEEDDGDTFENVVDRDRVIPEDVAAEATRMLGGVVTSGTGTNADLGVAGQWGKTGTTDDNGDAWFCGALPGEGSDPGATACVWVGYPDEVIPMTTEYGGAPVDGGTFPALIWGSVMSSWLELQPIREAEEAEAAAEEADEEDAAEEADEEGALPGSIPEDPDGAEDNDALSSE